jgi:hypothetical protein
LSVASGLRQKPVRTVTSNQQLVKQKSPSLNASRPQPEVDRHRGCPRGRSPLVPAGFPGLGQDLRPELDLMRTLKRALDPGNILNPGKILPD